MQWSCGAEIRLATICTRIRAMAIWRRGDGDEGRDRSGLDPLERADSRTILMESNTDREGRILLWYIFSSVST
jgi:hypothetical protein